MWEQKEFTKPLPEPTLSVSPRPWGKVGFTHTNDVVPPKSCRLESWSDSILTCTFFFKLRFFLVSFLPFFLE